MLVVLFTCGCSQFKENRIITGSVPQAKYWFEGYLYEHTLKIQPIHSEDNFIRKVRKIYQQINEQSMETNYEFLSEADMEQLGWSESPSCI